MTRAAVLRDGTSTLVIELIELDAPAPREVRVRTTACGLCHSDYHVLDGTLQRPRPHVLGHEATGIVEAIGADVRDVAVGDHVVTCLVQGCGSCGNCVAGRPTMCSDAMVTRRPSGSAPRLRTTDGATLTAFANIGALSEHLLVDERALTVVPADVPAPLAAILGCAVVTGLGAVRNIAGVQPGESVAVIGCGGVGLSVVQGARIAGARPIIAVDLSATKLDAARQMGATDVVDASHTDAVAAVHEITAGGVDHAFEVVGRSATAQQAMAMAAIGRAAYVVGVMSDDATVEVRAEHLKRGKTVHGVYMGATNPRTDIARYVELWRSGALDLERMVSRTLPLDEVNEGFRALADGEVNRAVVVFDS